MARRDGRDELLDAAIELFARNGYAGTSIRDIAKLTGRSVSNVYHYFEDKESLWLAILEHSVQGLPEVLRAAAEGGADPRDRFRRTVAAHLARSVQHRREAKIFFIDEERLSPAGKRMNRRVQKEIRDAAKLLMDPEARAFSITGQIGIGKTSIALAAVSRWHVPLPVMSERRTG